MSISTSPGGGLGPPTYPGGFSAGTALQIELPGNSKNIVYKITELSNHAHVHTGSNCNTPGLPKFYLLTLFTENFA